MHNKIYIRGSASKHAISNQGWEKSEQISVDLIELHKIINKQEFHPVPQMHFVFLCVVHLLRTATMS